MPINMSLRGSLTAKLPPTGQFYAPDPQAAEDALFSIPPPPSRDEWIALATSAKRAGASFDAFHDWSKTGEGYESERRCRTDWNSITGSGSITPATLFGTARDYGWRSANPDAGLRRSSNDIIIGPATPTTVVNPKAQAVWDICIPAMASHHYIEKKKGIADGVRCYPADATPLVIQGENVAGSLVLPCMSSGQIQTLQFILPSGKKLNLPGASFNDGYHVVGDIQNDGTVYVAEGVGQAWACNQASASPAVCSFGAGRMKTVAEAIARAYPTVKIVLVPDRGKEIDAAAIAATLGCHWVQMPEKYASNYDANDFAQEHGSVKLNTLLTRTTGPLMRYKLLSASELANAKPQQWMIQGLLPVAGLACLYGQSGSGKSFLTLDLAATVAGGGTEWFGKRVKNCPVTYCVLEGEAGMGKRILAWCQHHNKIAPDRLRFVTQPVSLVDPDDVVDLADAIKQAGGLGGLVILDTLNRAAPNTDENSSKDMGIILAAAKQLQELIGGLVLLVHHTGKDATKGPRGHSSLYAALDGAIGVHMGTTGPTWQVSKSKDDATGAIHPFQLEVVVTGEDEYGEQITSCVAISTTPASAQKPEKELPVQQRVAKDVLWPLLTAVGGDIIRGAAPRMSHSDATTAVAEKMDVEPKRKRERAKVAIECLIKRGLLCEDQAHLWIHP